MLFEYKVTEMLKLVLNSGWIVLLPSMVTFIVVIINKHAVKALIAGIVTSLLIINHGINYSFFISAWDHVKSTVMSGDNISWDNIFILLFLWFLGTFICVLNNSGAIDAIAEVFDKKIKTPTQAKIVTFFLGLFFFIDDYFNSLAIGTASRSLYDKRGVSREKLAYYLDSTAAPVCILVPISSWGAVIINILDTVIANLNIADFKNGFELFMSAAVYNYYSFATLAILFFVSITNFDFPLMAKYEKAAIKLDHHHINDNNNLDQKLKSAIYGIIALFIFAIIFMVLTGYYRSPLDDKNIFTIISNIKLGLSLFLSSIVALFVTTIIYPIKKKQMFINYIEGFKTMAPAMQILTLAWIFSYSMAQLKVGTYISTLMQSDFVTSDNIPIASFIIASIMSLLTGTSWVTFSILIPIVCELCLQFDPTILSISIGAVLAGAVFGDHCSPISDTSILSSTGAGCNHMNHIFSQLPYCILAYVISIISYFILMM